MKKTFAQKLKSFLIVTIGSVFYAAGVSLFLAPNELASGGVSGVAIIISSVEFPEKEK